MNSLIQIGKKYPTSKNISGFISVVPVPNGIAVVANSTWRAMKCLEVLNPKF